VRVIPFSPPGVFQKNDDPRHGFVPPKTWKGFGIRSTWGQDRKLNIGNRKHLKLQASDIIDRHIHVCISWWLQPPFFGGKILANK